DGSLAAVGLALAVANASRQARASRCAGDAALRNRVAAAGQDRMAVEVHAVGRRREERPVVRAYRLNGKIAARVAVNVDDARRDVAAGPRGAGRLGVPIPRPGAARAVVPNPKTD